MDKSSIKRELDKLLDEFLKWDDERRRTEEDRSHVTSSLHHYTDMASLVGIVGAGKLWFTNTLHMNDPSELRYGSQLAIEHLFDIMSSEATRHVHGFCEALVKNLDAAYEAAFSIFVTSFSKTPDDLPQWQTYADNGRGVAIEVSPEWFKPDSSKVWKAGASDPREYYAAANVVYEEAAARQRQNEAIDKAINLLSRAETQQLLVDEALTGDFLKELRVGLGVPLLWNSITTKHDAYKHEAETRLLLTHQVSVIAPHVCSRARGGQIVSYVPIDFPITTPGILRRIWIGPAAIGDAERGVADLLRAKGIDPKGLIEHSRIPYRPR